MIDSASDTPLLLYAGVNILAFALFAFDKFRAQVNAARIPDTSLLLVAAFGPAGALAAMMVCRHKTRQGKFLLVPFFLLLHLFFFFWLMSPLSG
jgi:uncharacterized membrane protein YsdA (DUF1294 family)